MANRAFNDAQCLDPSYTEAWIGQATIAEMFGHEESMDLFRHSNELGSHVRNAWKSKTRRLSLPFD